MNMQTNETTFSHNQMAAKAEDSGPETPRLTDLEVSAEQSHDVKGGYILIELLPPPPPQRW